MLMTLCRLFPAYTPETAAEAPIWVWQMVGVLMESGAFEVPHGE